MWRLDPPLSESGGVKGLRPTTIPSHPLLAQHTRALSVDSGLRDSEAWRFVAAAEQLFESIVFGQGTVISDAPFHLHTVDGVLAPVVPLLAFPVFGSYHALGAGGGRPAGWRTTLSVDLNRSKRCLRGNQPRATWLPLHDLLAGLYAKFRKSDGRPRSGAAPPVAGLERFFTVRSRH